MIRCVSVETMRKSDAWTIANRTSSKELMFRAGKAIFEAVDWKAPVAIVCGKGNNAGDGFVVASLLREHGIDCTLVLLSDVFSEDGGYYYNICAEKSVPVCTFAEDMELTAYGTILDCLFGTGFSGEPRGLYAAAITAINRSGAYIVSADISSGINGDSGEGGTFVRSDLTVSIGDFKPGHFLGKGKLAAKRVVNADIGIEIQGDYIWLDEENTMETLIKGVHHVSLRCKDEAQFEETKHFYHNILGLPFKRTWGTGAAAGAMLDAGNCLIEIFAAGCVQGSTGSLNHLAFATNDPDACIETVRAAGYKITREPTDVVIASEPALPARVAFCVGPVGEEIEFFWEK